MNFVRASLMLILLLACITTAGNQKAWSNNLISGGLAETTQDEISFEVIDYSQLSQITTEGVVVITKQKQWKKLWRQAHPLPPLKNMIPDVDFNTSMVVAISRGFQPGG